MNYSPLLAPVVALVAWSIVVMVWMAIARGREFRRLGISRSTIPPGSRGTVDAASNILVTVGSAR